jgi:exodeoxyribonuclease V gamma subunit
VQALEDRLAGRPTRASFRTGHLTVCTLYPMRSVRHRVVRLLGLDDGAFPRKSPRDGDDLMLVDPRIGERDPRSEDRQLLLDALLAATDHLVITYAGNDERTNIPRHRSVPVGELLDVVDATVRTETASAREQVVVRHPLQPFDCSRSTPAISTATDWSTISPGALTARRSRARERCSIWLIGPA